MKVITLADIEYITFSGKSYYYDYFTRARRGEPKLGMAQSARDVGGGACGGFVFFAGGENGKI